MREPLSPTAKPVRARGVVLLALLVVTAAAYLPAAGGQFHWDDDRAVIGNRRVIDPSTFSWRNFVPPSLGTGRPLTELTFALNHAVSGNVQEPFLYTNVAIHLAAVLLAFLASRRILRRAGHAKAEGLALAAAAIFALHPLQTEAVSFICQRAESLASALYLAGLLAWLKAEERHPESGWLAWFALGAAAWLAAIAAKGIAISLPAVTLVVMAVAPGGRRRGRTFWIAAGALPVAVAIVLGVATVRGLSGSAGLDAGPLGPWRYLLTEAWVIPQYVRLLIWPAGQSVDHLVRNSPGLQDPVTLVYGLGMLLAIVAACAAVWRASAASPAERVASLGVLWYLLLLAPTSTVIPLNDPMAEHRVYLANLGLILALLVALDLGLNRLVHGAWEARVRIGLAAAVVLSLAAALVERNRIWHDGLTLWADAAEKAPSHYRPQQHYGNALWGLGRVQEALAYYRRAAELVPGGGEVWVTVQIGYANGLSSAGNPGAALAVLDAAVGRIPGHVRLRESRGWIRYSMGDLDGVMSEVRTARAMGMDSSDLAGVMGKAAASRGDVGTALVELRRSVTLDPTSSLRRSDLAIVAFMAGLRAEACSEIARFIELEKEPGPRYEGVKLRTEWGCR